MLHLSVDTLILNALLVFNSLIFDSVSDYPLELKGSPDAFESVTSTYKSIRDDDARHVPHASGNIFFVL